MGKTGVKAKKKLGQHFLKDKGIAAEIVDSLKAEKCDTVLEIGPGTGVLTQFLTERDFRCLKVVEIDSESVAYLKERITGRYDLIQGDFLKLDINNIGSAIALIGNFPYNISSQIFFKVIENRARVKEVVCMIQKEVADRICSGPGSRVYGILSVLLGAWYDIEHLFNVSHKVFIPPPKVMSAVIRLTRNKRESLNCDEELFISVVKCCFNQRRKMIRNPIKMLTGFETDNMPYAEMRAEQLSVEQFIELTNWVDEHR